MREEIRQAREKTRKTNLRVLILELAIITEVILIFCKFISAFI